MNELKYEVFMKEKGKKERIEEYECPALDRNMKSLNDHTKGSSFTKHDSGKPRMSLIPAAAQLEVAKVFTYGADKYGPNNYQKGADHSRYVDAAQRHINDYCQGNDKDKESELFVIAHAIASLYIVLESKIKGYGKDDR